MSGEVVLMTLVGGLGTVFGPVVGAFVVIGMQNYLAQIGAWVSQQSSIVPDRVFLETRLAEKEKEFVGRDVPAPPYWGGYLLAPIRLEFWQGRPNRLHDRFEYVKQADGSWRIQRLSP